MVHEMCFFSHLGILVFYSWNCIFLVKMIVMYSHACLTLTVVNLTLVDLPGLTKVAVGE